MRGGVSRVRGGPVGGPGRRGCDAASGWDKRLCLLLVVEAGERSMQLRVLVTSSNSSVNWDLRCKLREALIDCMQREYPQHLPQMRAELTDPRRPQEPPSPACNPPAT